MSIAIILVYHIFIRIKYGVTSIKLYYKFHFLCIYIYISTYDCHVSLYNVLCVAKQITITCRIASSIFFWASTSNKSALRRAYITQLKENIGKFTFLLNAQFKLILLTLYTQEVLQG